MQIPETALQPLTDSRSATPLATQRDAAAGADDYVPRETREHRVEGGGRDERAPAFERNSRARLSLDPDLHRVFVEIVDSKTGDVISRFPPEQLISHIDEVLEQTGQRTNLQDSGLIVDQTV